MEKNEATVQVKLPGVYKLAVEETAAELGLSASAYVRMHLMRIPEVLNQVDTIRGTEETA